MNLLNQILKSKITMVFTTEKVTPTILSRMTRTIPIHFKKKVVNYHTRRLVAALLDRTRLNQKLNWIKQVASSSRYEERFVHNMSKSKL